MVKGIYKKKVGYVLRKKYEKDYILNLRIILFFLSNISKD